MVTKPTDYVSYTIQGLSNGTTYYVKYQSTNAIGTTESEVYTVVPGAPGPPTNLKLVKGDGSATFSWSPPTELRGATITGYQIFSGENANNLVATLNANTTSYTVSGLTNGTNNTTIYKIRATSNNGDGVLTQFPYIGWVGVPTAPTITSISNVGSTTGGKNFTVNWNAANTNGSAITNYKIYNNSTLLATVGNVTTATLNWTSDNTNMNIYVSAVNARGEGAKSAVKTFKTLGPPAAATDVSATATGVSNQITVKWTSPSAFNVATNGVVDAVQIVSGSTMLYSCPTSGSVVGAGKSNSVTFRNTDNLPNGTAKTIQVKYHTAYGWSTSAASAAVTPYTNPSAPTGITVTPGTNQLTVSWAKLTTAAETGGRAVSNYRIYEKNGNTYTEKGRTADGNVTSYTIKGLGSGESHTYVVRAYNGAQDFGSGANAGESTNSTAVTGKTYAVPDAISEVSAKVAGEKSVQVQWAQATTDGAPITSYIVSWTCDKAGNSGAKGAEGSQTLAVSSLTLTGGYYSYTVTGLARGNTYTFSVTPVNAPGNGTATSAAPVRTYDQPTPPESVTAQRGVSSSGAPLSGNVRVSWDAPNDSHDSTNSITYKVQVYNSTDGGNTIGTLEKTVNAGAATQDENNKYYTNITGLTNGNVYYFRVIATNSIGDSEPSVVSTSASAAPMYYAGSVTPIKAIADQEPLKADKLDVEWGYAPENGAGVEEYRVLVFTRNHGSPVTADGTGVEGANDQGQDTDTYGNIVIAYPDGRDGHKATITGLNKGTTYQIAVVARNELGWTPQSGYGYSDNVTTLSEPGIPQHVTAVATGNNMLAIDWTDAVNFGGTPVTGYKLYMYDYAYAQANGGNLTFAKMQELMLTDGYDDGSGVPEDGEEQGTGANKHKYNPYIRIRTVTVEDLKANLPEDAPEDADYTQWITQTALPEGKTYRVRIQATNAIGDSTWSEAVTVTPYGPPRIVANAKAEIQAGAESIKLTWSKPEDENGLAGDGGAEIIKYYVRISQQTGKTEAGEAVWTDITEAVTVPEGVTVEAVTNGEETTKYLSVPKSAGLSLMVSDLTRGETYRAELYAVNKGEGETDKEKMSQQPAYTQTVTLWEKPSAVEFITAQPSNEDGELALTWGAPEYDGNVLDVDGNHMNAAADRTEITDYHIYYRLAGEDGTFTGNFTEVQWDETPADQDGVFTQTLITLHNGSSYQVYVAPVNGAGEPEFDPETTPAAVGIPRCQAEKPVIGAVDSGDSSATLTSITPGNTGGSPIEIYRIYATELDAAGNNPVGDPEWKRDVTAVEGVMEDVTIPDLVNGTWYAITVTAVNGTQKESEASGSEKVKVGLPLPPRDLTVEPGKTFTAVAKFKPAMDNGSSIMHYLAYMNGKLYLDDSGKPKEFATTTDKDGYVTVTLSAEEAGETVTVQISAVNRVGESVRTESISVKIGAPTTPQLKTPKTSGTGVDLEWSQSQGNGIAIVGYNLYIRSKASHEDPWPEDWGEPVATVKKNDAPEDGSEIKYTLEKEAASLKAGVQYQVMVRAENLVGESADSEWKDFSFGVPTPPELQNVKFASGELVVSFKESTPGVGETITKYTVYASGVKKQEIDPTKVEAAVPADAIKDKSKTVWYETDSDGKRIYYVRLTDLANGSEYSIQATASNEFGESPMSDALPGTPATQADAPRDVFAEAASANSIQLSWKQPLYNGGARIQSYVVKIYEVTTPTAGGAPVSTYLEGRDKTATGTSLTIDKLEQGHTYQFSVEAVTEAGNGTPGSSNAERTFREPDPATITTYRSSYDSGSGSYNLEINWEAPKDTGGTPITGYKVWVGGSLKSGGRPTDGTMLSPDTRTFTITGLSATNYNVRVEAFNSVCSTTEVYYGAGAVALENITVGKLDAPVITKVTPTTDEITIEWDEVEGVFEYYRVFDLNVVMNQANVTTVEEALKYIETQWQGNILGGDTIMADQPRIYTASSIDPGVHYYAIRCYTKNGVGGYISEVCEVTLGGALNPNGLTVKAGYEALDVSFQALSTDALNGKALTGYQILLGGKVYSGKVTRAGSDTALAMDASGVITDLSGDTGTIRLCIPELIGNAAYTVAVRGVTYDPISRTYLNGLVSSAQEETVWTNPKLPEVTKVVSGNGGFTVSFREADGMGRPVEGYAVFYDNGEDPIEQATKEELRDDLTLEVTGVTNGYKDKEQRTGFPYYVAAYTLGPDGTRYYSQKPETQSTIVTGIPGAPRITRALADSGSITVSYTGPDMEASLAVRSYEVLVYQGETLINTIPTQATTCEIRNLSDNVSYTIKVRAVNGVGAGPESEGVTLVPGTPTAPDILDYSVGDQQITVRWGNPTSPTGRLTSYRVYYTDLRDNSRYYENVDVNLHSITLNQVENGVTYQVEVAAFNENGQGQLSQTLELMPGGKPGTPRELAATVLGSDRVTLSWTEPESNGGLSIDYYEVVLPNGAALDAATNSQGYVDAGKNYKDTEDGKRYTVTVTGLTGNTSYSFGVKAHNRRDFGDEATSPEVKTFTNPGRPTITNVSSVNNTITVEWAPLSEEETGGSDIIGYYVCLTSVGGISQSVTGETPIPLDELETGVDEFGDEYISYTIEKQPDDSNLVLGATYQVSVKAQSAVGTGVESGKSKITVLGQTADSVPGRPGRPVVVAGSHQVTVAWTAPLIEGVKEGLLGYSIYYQSEAMTEAKSVWHNNLEDLTETITDLDNGTAYRIWVVATNSKGNSSNSIATTATPKDIEAPKWKDPAGFSYQNNAQMTAMTIAWDEADAKEDGGTVYYDVYVNNSKYTTTDLEKEIQVESGVKYNIWIVARNNGGETARDEAKPDMVAYNWLNVETTGIPGAKPNLNLDTNFDGVLDPDQIKTKPTAPTNLKAVVNGASSITLTWDTPKYENSDMLFEDIEYYKIYVNGTEYGNVETAGGSNQIIFQEDIPGDGGETTKGLKGGIYSFQVSAVNEKGEGATSIPYQIYVQKSPDPSNLRGALEGEGTSKYTNIRLDWNKPVDDTRIPDRYWIQVNGTDTLKVERGSAMEPATTFLWTGAQPNTNYVFRVWAEYDADPDNSLEYVESKTTNPVILSTQLEAPGAPQNLTAAPGTAEGETCPITLNWEQPAGGAPSYYILYVNGAAQEETIPGTATSFPYDGAPDTTYVFSLSSVIKVGEASQEGIRSNSAVATTSLLVEGAPEAPQGLTAQVNGKTITLTWNPVDNADGDLQYAIYIGRDNGELGELSEIEGYDNYRDQIRLTTDPDVGTQLYTYDFIEADEPGANGHDYVFLVRAERTVEGQTPVLGAMSLPVETSTVVALTVPSAPQKLEANVQDSEIILSWNAPEETVTGYQIYLDAVPLANGKISVDDEGFERTAPTFTYPIDETTNKRSFYFQVVAINEAVSSELSEGVSVSLDSQITELPKPAAAPVIKKSIHQKAPSEEDRIRVYWEAPTTDADGNPLSGTDITGYRINIVQLREDGSTETSRTIDFSSQDHPEYFENDLWFYDIITADEAFPIQQGKQYSVTIAALRSLTVGDTTETILGAIQNPWIIMQGLNVDNNGDWVVDESPDTGGTGTEDTQAGTLVTLTATMQSGDTEPEVTISDGTSEIESKVNYDPETKLLTVSYRVMASSGDGGGSYSIRISRPGSTYFELQDIPMKTSVTKIDLTQTIGLLQGDTNNDGVIDGADLDSVKKHYRQSAEEYTNGDINGDGVVDGADLDAVKKNYRKQSVVTAYDSSKQ